MATTFVIETKLEKIINKNQINWLISDKFYEGHLNTTTKQKYVAIENAYLPNLKL